MPSGQYADRPALQRILGCPLFQLAEVVTFEQILPVDVERPQNCPACGVAMIQKKLVETAPGEAHTFSCRRCGITAYGNPLRRPESVLNSSG
jgi:predicted RNA-binding Zn-ribbon protein involved in translation (DUF1610 family)